MIDESREKPTFEETIQQIQKSYHMRFESSIKKYFVKCYEDLLLRNMNKETNEQISKIIFVNFLNLPILVGEKIFKHFVKNNKSGVLIKENFVDGMLNLYFGSFSYLLEFTFDILDFSLENKIIKENVILFYSYLNSEETKFETLDEMFSKFFSSSNELSFEVYKNKIKTECSDLFFILLFEIYSRQPFTEEVLKFNSKISQKIFYSKMTDIPEETRENDSDLEITIPLINFNNYLVWKQNQRENNEKKIIYVNKMSKDNLKIFKENSKENSPVLIPSLLDTHLEIEKINKKKIEFTVYKYDENKEFKKFKIVLVENNVFCFSFCEIRNSFVLHDIHPLNGYLIEKIQPKKILEETYFPLAFLQQWGLTTVKISNFIFFKNEDDSKTFYEKLNMFIYKREFNNYYEIKGEIGKGEFGSNNLCINNSTKEKLAVKLIEKKKILLKDLEIIRNEVEVMKFLIKNPHENIIKVYDIFEDKNLIYIVMEYSPCGNLTSYLEMMGECLEENHIKILSLQFAKGLKFLSKFGILHGDLKPDHILICLKNLKPSLKISEFGLCKVLGVNESLNDLNNENYGTVVYTAPEILSNHFYNSKVDIWSFGVVLFSMLFGFLPFDGEDLTLEEITNLICNSPMDLNGLDDFSEDVLNLVQSCLTKNSTERFTIDQVLDSKWFS